MTAFPYHSMFLFHVGIIHLSISTQISICNQCTSSTSIIASHYLHNQGQSLLKYIIEVIHKNFSWKEKLDMNIHYRLFRMEVNPLAAELRTQCNVQKTGDLYGHPLFRMFLANDWVASSLLGTTPILTIVNFQHWRVNP